MPEIELQCKIRGARGAWRACRWEVTDSPRPNRPAVEGRTAGTNTPQLDLSTVGVTAGRRNRLGAILRQIPDRSIGGATSARGPRAGGGTAKLDELGQGSPALGPGTHHPHLPRPRPPPAHNQMTLDEPTIPRM